MTSTHTLILGGGFGGIAAANALRSLLPIEHDIVVIDETADFHIGAGNTWVMLGRRTPEQISQSRRALLDPGVKFIQAQILGLDLAARSLALPGQTLTWDYLVIALGAALDMAKTPGLAEAAHTFYTLDGAQRLKGALDQFSGGELVILIPKAPFKCPPAPYEAAMLLHDSLRSRGLLEKTRIAIYTVEGAPMATAGPEMGQYIKAELAGRGIAFHPQKATRQVEPAAKRILFEDGSQAAYDLLIAVPPHEAPRVVQAAGLTNQSGWIPVDPQTLQVQGAPEAGEIYAIGDVTAVDLPGRFKPEIALSLPKAGVFAEAHGRVVAGQIAAGILGEASGEPFDGKGFCYIELGGDIAVRGEGAFFELPHPLMVKRPADAAQFRDKLEWVAAQLKTLR